MGRRAETTSWMAGRLWAVALLTVPALVIFADHRWTDVVFMFLAGPSWPVQVALGGLAATILARLALAGGAPVVVAALVAGQPVAHRHGEHADLGAFTVAAFQVALTIVVLEALRDGWRGAPSASLASAPVRDQAWTYGLALLAGLVAWWSGLAAWLLGGLGSEDSGLVVSVLAGTLALRAAILLHELGHAAVAVRRLRTRVALRVGRRGRPVTVTVAGVEANLHLLDVLGSSGAVEADGADGTVDDVIAIVLAGPAASLAGMVAGLAVLAATSATGGLFHGLVWWFTVMNGIGVLNLLPFRVQIARGAPFLPSDGRQLLDALAVKAALR